MAKTTAKLSALLLAAAICAGAALADPSLDTEIKEALKSLHGDKSVAEPNKDEEEETKRALDLLHHHEEEPKQKLTHKAVPAPDPPTPSNHHAEVKPAAPASTTASPKQEVRAADPYTLTQKFMHERHVLEQKQAHEKAKKMLESKKHTIMEILESFKSPSPGDSWDDEDSFLTAMRQHAKSDPQFGQPTPMKQADEQKPSASMASKSRYEAALARVNAALQKRLEASKAVQESLSSADASLKPSEAMKSRSSVIFSSGSYSKPSLPNEASERDDPVQ